ncbi:MAG: hypothetical protein ACE5IY_13215 [bacterium]
MRFYRFAAMIGVLFLFASSGLAQKRNNQWELFIGAAVPLGPEGIQDAVKVGVSVHGQYVMFLSPQFGISLGISGEGFTQSDELSEFGIEGELTVAELGFGLRPYLTSMESSLQLYLFGMATYSRVEATFLDEDLGFEVNAEESKPGVAFGGGIEIPAGPRFNLLFQGLTRIIFTEGDSFSFIGITGGVAF